MIYPTKVIQTSQKGSILLTFIFVAGALFFITIGCFLIFLPILFHHNTGAPEFLSILMLAGGLITLGLLMLPGLYFNLRKYIYKLENYPDGKFINNKVFFPLVVIAWSIILTLGQITLKYQDLTPFLLPIINIFAVCLPITFFVGISLRKIALPSCRRMWSILGASIIITPTLSFILESLVLFSFIGILLLFARFLPELHTQINSLIVLIQSKSPGEDEIIQQVAKLISSPWVAISTFGVFSIAVPIIEETMKISLLWFFRDAEYSPSDGFVLGTLCGAAFALVENISFSSSGSADWTTSAFIRASAVLPHVFNSGMLGWALFSARRTKRYTQFAKTFITVLLIHGVWNAISLGLALSNINSFFPNTLIMYVQNSYFWIFCWFVLACGVFAGLILNNYKIQQLNNRIEIGS